MSCSELVCSVSGQAHRGREQTTEDKRRSVNKVGRKMDEKGFFQTLEWSPLLPSPFSGPRTPFSLESQPPTLSQGSWGGTDYLELEEGVGAPAGSHPPALMSHRLSALSLPNHSESTDLPGPPYDRFLLLELNQRRCKPENGGWECLGPRLEKA